MRRARKAIGHASAWLQRRARRRDEAHGAILMYHRVATTRIDPWRLCVSPDNFDAQMQVLRETCDVVPLSRLRGELRSGRRGRPVVSVTFDDGYRDNLTVARPILGRHGIPATVFVITGYLGGDVGFWWDRLAEAILGASTLPVSLSVRVGAAEFRRDDAALSQRGSQGDGARRALHEQLWQWIVDLPDAERTIAVGVVEKWAGTTAPRDASRCPMHPEELRELAAGGLVDIGAHTVAHPRLTRLSSADRREQIAQSRGDLERLLGRAPQAFSYPNGDRDAECLALVRGAGFEIGCDSRWDLVWASSDAYALPRISVRDEPGPVFRRRLCWDLFA